MSNIEQVKARVRETINLAVAHGDIAPEDALTVVMNIAVTMVAQVSDEHDRKQFVRSITRHFPTMVNFVRTSARWAPPEAMQ